MPSAFGTAVKERREQRGLSRKALAQLTQLTEGKVWSIENGRDLKPGEREALVAALELDGVESPTRSTPVPSPRQPALVEVLTPSAPLQTADTPPLMVPSIGGGPVREEGVRLISNSEIQTFKSCRRKWWLTWHRGLRPHRESAVGPRAIGDRIHRALRLYYLPKSFGPYDPRVALERLIIDDWTALTVDDQPTMELRRRFDQEANLERIMLDGYLQWLAETGEDADFEVIEPETYVENTLDMEHALYSVVKLIGRLDVRAQRLTDGAIVFVDHKTVASIIAKIRGLALDEQMLHYHLLEWLNSEPDSPRADGALYNMLRRVKRTPGAKPPFYARVHVPHNDHELRSYRMRIMGTVSDMLNVEQSLQRGADHRFVAYPRQSNECTWCPFFEVCGMLDDGSRAEAMLSARFETADPLEYYQIEQSGGTGTVESE